MVNVDRDRREIQFIKSAFAEAQRKREAERGTAREAANEAVKTGIKRRWKVERQMPLDNDELIVGADSIARVLGKDWNSRRVRYYHGKGYLPTEKLGRHIVVWRSRLMNIAR